MNPNVKQAKVKDPVPTFRPLSILRRALMPEEDLALSHGKIGLGLVKGKVFLDEQSFQPSDLTRVPLGSCALLLGLLGTVTGPLLQGSNLFPGFTSLGREI